MKTKLTVAVLWVGAGLLGIQPGTAQSLDFGDAPEGALAYPASGVFGTFPTCQNVPLSGWIQHGLGWARFGSTWDAEIDGNAGMCPLFNPNMYNQDECYLDNDAGLIIPDGYTITGLQGAEMVVPCSATSPGLALGTVCQTAGWGPNVDIIVFNNMPVVGYVNVLMDWDQNGVWAGGATCPGGAAPEHVLINFPVPAGFAGPLSALQPPGFLIGPNAGYVWSRFTITEQPIMQLPWTGEGMFEDGESEDYLLKVDAGQEETLDFGDAPDPSYPTLLATNGARHVIVSGGPWFGDATDVPDAEVDGQPDATATGDDNTGNDDEDGVVFSALMAGQQGVVRFQLNCPAGSAYVDAWVDWNMDGAWSAGEQIISGWFGTGTHSVPVTPPGPNGTTTFARFRVNSTGPLAPTGLAADGEVEDHLVQIAPVKWLQPPDLTTNGVDVANTLVHLADDFLCTASGPITDIHIWTSLYKNEGWVQYTNLSFSLFLYTDVPAGPDNLYSHPGELIWSRNYAPGEYQAFIYSAGTDEWWHDPLQNMWEYPGDSMVFEYDFYIPEQEAFRQTKGTIYWLGVKFDELEPGGIQLGWKSSNTNWNDDACWLDESTGLPTWQELFYGDAHPRAGNSMDFAFAVTGLATGEPDLDFGDAPDPSYPTLLPNGARHVIVSGGPWLGGATDTPDPELNGQPDPNALGDDNDGNDDENGVTFSPLTVGQPGSVNVIVSSPSGSAWVDAWVDWNQNGIWEDPAERIMGGNFASGAHSIALTPLPPYTGQTYARFRVHSSQANLLPTGLAQDGEVEDYELFVREEEPELLDFGDAPDPNYPTRLPNGARHVIQPNFYLGARVDAEADGQPTARADGDDNNPPAGLDDEDGVTFATALFSGVQNRVQVVASVPAGVTAYFNMWIDLNGDGDWTDPGEQVVVDNGAFTGIQWYYFTPGPITAVGSTFVRCRLSSLSTAQGLSDQGLAPDGEVEDQEIPLAPVKWLQPPDLNTTGVDVAFVESTLADDFQCIQTGPITDIHLWTSFYHDGYPEDLTTLPFTLELYSDVPADPTDPGSYSHPGVLLWSRDCAPGSYAANRIAAALDEWWHDPLTGLWEPHGDTQVYQYDFIIPKEEAFVQTEGTIYWLAVRYLPPPTPVPIQMGWKSSLEHWQDDAVWWNPLAQAWQELRYGGDHPMAPETMDLAFAITGVEGELPDLDFGDAPEGALAYPASGTFGMFPTCKGVGPANWIQHGLGWARFGQGWDPEADGNAGFCPLFNPYDRDECFNDGDAGLMYPDSYTIVGLPGAETIVGCPTPMSSNALGTVCQAATWGKDLDIFVINAMPVVGYVNVLMDWDQNGAWGGVSMCPLGGAPEHVLVNFPVPVGYSAPLSGLLPPNFVIGPNPGHVWCRFSISELPVLLPWTGDGLFEDGETEDYLLRVDPAVQIDLDFGDAPDPTYPTLAASSGANHVYVPSVFMGKTVDYEPDGQPDATATGDDLAGAFDEDGFTPTSPFYAGGSGTFDVECSVNGFLSVWIDFNADGDWTDPGENIFVTNAVNAGTNTFAFVIPGAAAVPGQTFMRFRFTTQQIVLADTGPAPDGEVEDHRVTILEEVEFLDYGDAWDSMTGGGYPTLLRNNGARHALLPGVFLGNGVDLEPDGQPDPNALGDDQNLLYPGGIPFPPGDEDGVIIPAPLVAGAVVPVTVFASVPGFLNAWIDFNANSTWIDPGEQVCFNWPLNPGPNLVPVTVPPYPATLSGGPHSRWRFTTYMPMMPMFTGAEKDGEVEDYEVRLEVLDFGDAPDPLYPTLLVNDGARHRMPSAYYLGIAPDQDPDGQPDAQALGDDNANVDDEDLVATLAKAVQGETKTIVATASTNGFLNIWIDFDQSGSWDASEQVVADQALVPGANNVAFTTPQAAKLGTTFARVRFCSYRGLAPTGFAHDGEVEDYEVAVFQNGPDPSTFRITNIVYSAPGTATIWWASASNVTYQTQWASNLLSDSNVTWTIWGSDVIGPTNTQMDPNAAASTRFYRVVAPYAPPPP